MTETDWEVWAALEAADTLAVTYQPVEEPDNGASERLAREAYTLGVLLAGFEALDAECDDDGSCLCGHEPCVCRW